MKKLLVLISVLSVSAFAQDSMRNQILSKKIQTSISAKINQLQAIDTSKTSLSEYVQLEEDSCLSNAKGKIELEQVCFDNTKRLYEIADLDTIIDLDIAKLTEFQTSFVLTTIIADELSFKQPIPVYILLGLALPVTILGEFFLFPVYFIVLLASA